MDPLFQVHKLNKKGLKRAQAIASLFDDALNLLSTHCRPWGREWLILKTKLEEACFFAKKAMASDPDNQEK